MKPADRIFFLFGGTLFLALHLIGLRALPGLHFDEAWALNHAWRIAEGEFTLQGMSPYTAPWAHYWAALWMKLFGPGLAVFRLSQMFFSLAGSVLLSAALWKSGKRSAALFLPLVIALLPGLVMNHRFAIELTGFHAFCLGLGYFALSRRSPWLAGLAWVLGSTSHVLFYGVGLAILAAFLWEGRDFSRKERAAAVGSLFLLAGFFLKVVEGIPEKGKGGALLASALLFALLLLVKAERWRIWKRQWWEALAVLGALVFLINALFFLEGFWTLSLTTGKQGWKGGRLINLLAFLPMTIWLAYRGGQDFPRWLRRAFLLTALLLGAMMLKPAPRYFEILFLGLAVFAAQGMARQPFLGRISVVAFLVLHSTFIFTEYFTLNPREAEIRFLFFKDSSRDFLSKQQLVSVLGGSGCALSDINSVDSRVEEALVALSRANWPVAPQPCRWKKLSVERRAASAGAGVKEEVADFVIWENP